MPGKNVAVIGGAGYVGSRLCEALVERGDSVLCIDALLYGDSRAAERKHIHPRYFFLEMNALNLSPYQLVGYDSVINLAGFSNDPTAQARPDLNWSLNVTLAAKIAQVAKEAGVKRLIYASSASIYHSGEYEYDAEVGEKFPVKPEWHYSCSKFAGELASLAFCDADLAVAVVRKGTISGPSPRMRYDLLLNTMLRSFFTKRRVELSGGGMLYRPLLDIDDAVSAYLALLDASETAIKGEIFNAVTENSTVKDYAERMRSELEKAGWPAPASGQLGIASVSQTKIVRSYKVSARKISEKLGWSPRGSAENVTRALVRCHRLGELQAFDDPSTENIKMIDQIERRL